VFCIINTPNFKNNWVQIQENYDGSTFFMERGGIVVVRIEFLRAVYKLRISGNKRPEFFLDETSVNHNH
jgi:hypothetical protein